MSKPALRELLNKIIIYGGEEGDLEWTLSEIEEDASWDISSLIIRHLESMKKPVAEKLIFGDTKSVENAQYNKAINDLILDLEEGVL